MMQRGVGDAGEESGEDDLLSVESSNEEDGESDGLA